MDKAMEIWHAAAEAERAHGSQAAAQVIREYLDAQEAKWVHPKTKADMPKKPGKANYEYVECLVLYKGDLLARPWNCEHEVFDDEDQDDFFCEWSDITAYMDLTSARQALSRTSEDQPRQAGDGKGSVLWSPQPCK